MPEYQWSCRVCGHSNAAGLHSCGKCASPSELTSEEIEYFQFRLNQNLLPVPDTYALEHKHPEREAPRWSWVNLVLMVGLVVYALSQYAPAEGEPLGFFGIYSGLVFLSLAGEALYTNVAHFKGISRRNTRPGNYWVSIICLIFIALVLIFDL
jgi:hypothetical protein